jgi:hypothetical protein
MDETVQDVGLETPSLGRGVSVVGERFGLLTAVRFFGRSDRGNRWLLQCDCGRFAVRRLSALRAALKAGREPQCSECLVQLMSGLSQDRRSGAGARWARMLALAGGLYSDRSEEVVRKDVVAALEAYLGFGADPESPRLPAEVLELEGPPSNKGQRAAFFVPLSGRSWRCGLCRQAFSDGFGCTFCLEVGCRSCVRLELHPGGCGSSGAVWERHMTVEQASLLPSGDPLAYGVTGIVQPHLPAAVRRGLVASLRPKAPVPEPPAPRPARLPGKVVFDWTEFRREP